jgi:uncharacterized protein with NRDE domain
MCLIALAWRVHPAYPLIVAANRDEFHERPTDSLAWWSDRPDIAGGRDRQAGGTWLAVSRTGRFATVTNYRENLQVQRGEYSRGKLVSDFVGGDTPSLEYVTAIDGKRYAGFSLLTASPEALAYVSNRGDVPRLLQPGLYGLSNASLDAPWCKILRSKKRLHTLLETDAVTVPSLFELLADREPAENTDMPDASLPRDKARAVSAPFIVTPEFGTRCSTVMLLGKSGTVVLHERRFDAAGRMNGESALDFAIG